MYATPALASTGTADSAWFALFEAFCLSSLAAFSSALAFSGSYRTVVFFARPRTPVRADTAAAGAFTTSGAIGSAGGTAGATVAVAGGGGGGGMAGPAAGAAFSWAAAAALPGLPANPSRLSTPVSIASGCCGACCACCPGCGSCLGCADCRVSSEAAAGEVLGLKERVVGRSAFRITPIASLYDSELTSIPLDPPVETSANLRPGVSCFA